ncbi:MAG: hypothetical protein KF819_01800 [Labilithrix sp.]|nr:hypothetical protein [Labilithrix sp.]
MVERETTPAPPNADVDAWVDIPSARPTALPEFDLAALAFETSVRHPQLPSIPLDVAVPAHTGAAPPSDLELRAAFVLLHIDGRSSVRDVAAMVDLPLDEVLARVLQLTALGLVELGGAAAPARAVPASGERRVAPDAPEDAPPDSR